MKIQHNSGFKATNLSSFEFKNIFVFILKCFGYEAYFITTILLNDNKQRLFDQILDMKYMGLDVK